MILVFSLLSSLSVVKVATWWSELQHMIREIGHFVTEKFVNN